MYCDPELCNIFGLEAGIVNPTKRKTFSFDIRWHCFGIYFRFDSFRSKQNVKAMPNPRPRGFSSGGGGGSGSSGSGRSAQNTPMSERQQMALLMQMTNQAGKS